MLEKTINDFMTPEQIAHANTYVAQGNSHVMTRLKEVAEKNLLEYNFALEIAKKIGAGVEYSFFPNAEYYGARIIIVKDECFYYVSYDERAKVFNFSLKDAYQMRNFLNGNTKFSEGFSSKNVTRAANRLLECIENDAKVMEVVKRNKEASERREVIKKENMAWLGEILNMADFYKHSRIAGNYQDFELDGSEFKITARGLDKSQVLRILDILKEKDCPKCHEKIVPFVMEGYERMERCKGCGFSRTA